MTQIRIYSHTYHHYDGKQYLLAIVRDHEHKTGQCYVIRNWGKQVHQDFSAGQVSVAYFANYHDAATDFNREHSKRSSHGYAKQSGMDRLWVDMTVAEMAMLEKKGGVDFSKFDSTSGGKTVSYDANGNEVEVEANGAQQPDWAAATEYKTEPQKKVVDPDAVPGPRTGGAKRLEWVVSHSEHPQAFDQMMQVASQMATERDKAATTVAAIDNDLEFVRAWLAQQMTKAG